MSETRLNILEAGRAIHGTLHGTEIDFVVAALSAGPTTIEELQSAISRFAKPVEGIEPFALFEPGINEAPCDAGISYVDLPARVVATEGVCPNPQTQGTILYHDGVKLTDVAISYFVPDDWLLLDSVAEYKCVRDLRRFRHLDAPPLDARAVLYGSVAEYIVRQCLAARDANTKDPVVEIHARWLMTPRDDLRGQSPRTVMLRQRECIEADLQSREDQWSRLGEPAPCLAPESAAYRFSGFGTHEIIVYYDLMRFLISKCWKHVAKKRSVSIEDEAARLRRLQSQWLHRPEKEFENRSAAYIIECERKRLPLVAPHDSEMFEDDCPLCKAMAGHMGPAFWHLDGCNMDDAFPFSFDVTLEEWEEEKERQKAFDEKFEREWRERGMKLFDDAPVGGKDHPPVH